MRKIIRNILKGVSLTSALFVFQACYGSPNPDTCPEYPDEGVTKSVTASQDEAEDAVEIEDVEVQDAE